jgi:hypothetical protein
LIYPPSEPMQEEQSFELAGDKRTFADPATADKVPAPIQAVRLAEKAKKQGETDCIMPWKAPAAEKDRRAAIEGQIIKGMGKVSKDRFNYPAT